MRRLLILSILVIGVVAIVVFLRTRPLHPRPTLTLPKAPIAAILNVLGTPTPVPKPDIPFVRYTVPKLPKKSAYTVVLLGDSMTAALGPYADELRVVLKKKYPGIDLIVQNESAPSSNVASLQDRLLSQATEAGTSYRPVLGMPFDIIIIESFGNNPLSYLGRVEGINKANEALTQAMKIVVREEPNALVIFLATIAPSHTMYGVGAVQLSSVQREDWATERDLYIENHLQFAKDHNIPFVDVYHLTKDKTGSGMLKYLNPGDYIHPSQLGVNLIQDQLANYFITAKVFE